MLRPLVKTLSLPSGIDICYAERGDAAGVPLVLLPGYTDSLVSFGRLVDALPQGIRTFSLSLRGHGDSSKPQSTYDSRELAGDILAFFDALALERAVVLGHSMGSLVARRFAIDNPSRTAGLVLIGSFLSTKGHPGIEELWRDISTFDDPVDLAFIRAFQAGSVNEPVPPAFLDTVVRESAKVPAHVWRAALAALRREDHAAHLDHIRAATLIVCGDRDTLGDLETQHALAAAIPGSRLAVLQGVGHSPHWERPAEVASLLAGFAPLLRASATRTSDSPMLNTDLS